MSSSVLEEESAPLPTFMGRTPSGNGDVLMRGFKGSFSQAPDPSDYHSDAKRRERVFMWHRRWAMPTYQRMKAQILKTPGLDITVADLDLLPWNKNGSGHLDNAAYHKMQRLAFSSRATLKRQQSTDKNDRAAMEAMAAELRAEEAEKAEPEKVEPDIIKAEPEVGMEENSAQEQEISA